MIKTFAELRELVKTFPPRRAAVAAAEGGVVAAAMEVLRASCGLGGVLVGDSEEIKKHVGSGYWEIVHEPDPAKASALAVEAVRAGDADLLVKGRCATSDYMGACLDPEKGLRRAGGVMVQVFAFTTGLSGGIKILSDAAINISPGASEKAALVENTVRFAHALGNGRPAVALLAALETVNTRMRDTVDAAEVAAMKERWDELGCDVAGPLSVDCAVNAEAAAVKEITGPVAGRAEIFIAPDLASANLFAKGIMYFAPMESGGIVLGGRAPIVLRSRADEVEDKVNSIAMGLVAAEKMFN